MNITFSRRQSCILSQIEHVRLINWPGSELKREMLQQQNRLFVLVIVPISKEK